MKAVLAPLQARWSALGDRDRRVLGSGGAALALILAWLLVWEPLAKARAGREAALADSRALATQLEVLAAELQRGGAARGDGAIQGASQSLLAIVDQSRKASSIQKPPSRMQPEGDGTVRVWLEGVPYDALVRWLNELQVRYGVRVDSADLERKGGPGLVDARLTLMRGASP